jgi:hypothetical protein
VWVRGSGGMYVMVCKVAPDKFRDIDAAVRAYQVRPPTRPASLPIPLLVKWGQTYAVCKAGVGLQPTSRQQAWQMSRRH